MLLWILLKILVNLPVFVLQVDDLQDKYHECLEMLMENQVEYIEVLIPCG